MSVQAATAPNYERASKEANTNSTLPAFETAVPLAFAGTMRLIFFILTTLHWIMAGLLIIVGAFVDWGRTEASYALLTIGGISFIVASIGIWAVIVHRPSISKLNFFVHAFVFLVALILYLVFIGLMWDRSCEFCQRASIFITSANVASAANANNAANNNFTPTQVYGNVEGACDNTANDDNYDATQTNLYQWDTTVYTCRDVQGAFTAILIVHLIWILICTVFAFLYKNETVSNYSPLFTQEYLDSILAKGPSKKEIRNLGGPDSSSEEWVSRDA